MRFSPTTALVCFALLGAASHASADVRSNAKAQFAEGERAFEREDYETALRHFRRAFELHEHDAVRFNIAVCLERLSRFREALAQYEAASGSQMLDEKQRLRAKTKADAVGGELGTLKVEGTPRGATVSVQGEVFCRVPCSTPIDPRKQEVVIQSGAVSETHSVQPRRQEETLIRVSLKVPDTTLPDKPAPPQDRPVTASPNRGASWLTWSGIGLVAVGGAGVAVFGSKAQSEHDDFVATGSEDARSAGSTARDLSNVSIGVAVVGVALVAYDLLVLAKKPEAAAQGRASSPGFRF